MDSSEEEVSNPAAAVSLAVQKPHNLTDFTLEKKEKKKRQTKKSKVAVQEQSKEEENNANPFRAANEAKKKLAAKASKGVKRSREKTSEYQIKYFSNWTGPGRPEVKKCKCKNNCYAGISWKTTERYRILLYGEGATNYTRRLFLYDHFCKELDRALLRAGAQGKSTCRRKLKVRYYLTCASTGRNMVVCRTTFDEVTGISNGTVQSVLVQARFGNRPAMDQRAQVAERKSKEMPEYLAISTFLESLTEDLSNMSPDMKKTELPSGTKKNYYEMFCEAWKEGVLKGLYHRSRGFFMDPLKPPSQSLFYRVWRTEFNSLYVPKRQNRFSKCDWCCTAKLNISESQNAGDTFTRDFWKNLLYKHYAWVVLQRKKYHKHRWKAAQDPIR